LSDNTTTPTGGENDKKQEPSLGPACLVVVVLGVAALIAVCSIASFFVFQDQPALAEKGINQLLVPWVESSDLAPAYKQQILSDLADVVEQVRSRQLTSRQLTRLRTVLEDNPVLLWGTVEQVLAKAEQAGLSPVEIEAAQRIQQRLLRSAAERKLGRNNIVFMLEKCTHMRADGQAPEVNEKLTDKDIRDFLSKAEKFCDGMKVSSEPFEKSPPEVFRGLIDEALSVK
jgi:hypothetical protein